MVFGMEVIYADIYSVKFNLPGRVQIMLTKLGIGHVILTYQCLIYKYDRYYCNGYN